MKSRSVWGRAEKAPHRDRRPPHRGSGHRERTLPGRAGRGPPRGLGRPRVRPLLHERGRGGTVAPVAPHGDPDPQARQHAPVLRRLASRGGQGGPAGRADHPVRDPADRPLPRGGAGLRRLLPRPPGVLHPEGSGLAEPGGAPQPPAGQAHRVFVQVLPSRDHGAVQGGSGSDHRGLRRDRASVHRPHAGPELGGAAVLPCRGKPGPAEEPGHAGPGLPRGAGPAAGSARTAGHRGQGVDRRRVHLRGHGGAAPERPGPVHRPHRRRTAGGPDPARHLSGIPVGVRGVRAPSHGSDGRGDPGHRERHPGDAGGAQPGVDVRPTARSHGVGGRAAPVGRRPAVPR